MKNRSNALVIYLVQLEGFSSQFLPGRKDVEYLIYVISEVCSDLF